MSVISIGAPLGTGRSTCGYCGPPGERSATQSSFTKGGLIASQLKCGVYQKMLDRGWRRSGTYCYVPDLKRSCCPQYTIKLDALAFKPSRNQRKLINRWNRFVSAADLSPTRAEQGTASTSKSPPEFCLVPSVHQSERCFIPQVETPLHNFEVALERSSYTDEKYALFKTYQAQVHRDHDTTSTSFTHFLVQTPLIYEPIQYALEPHKHLPTHYGSYHQLYRLDGELIALGVIDILPSCVSSVYFMYDPKWEKHSLGKLSVLREAALAREMHDDGVSSVTALYMGFYIHTCTKMKYKGDYWPSYLADPEEYTWHPLEYCATLLDKYHYATFSHPEHSLTSPITEDESERGENLDALVEGVKSIQSVRENVVSLRPVMRTRHWKNQYSRREIISCVRALGSELAREIVFRL